MISKKCETFLLRQASCEEDSIPPAKSLQKIARSVKMLSDHYISSPREPDRLYSDKALIQAYMLYYVPVNIIKLMPVLNEVLRCPELHPLGTRESFSVFDLGCGPGTFTLGALDYLYRRSEKADESFPRNITLHGIDAAENHIRTARGLIEDYISELPFADGARTSVRFEQCSLLSGSLYRRFADMAGSFDLIVAGNVFNEMPGKEAVSLCRLLETLLARNGVLVFIDPGTRRAFQNLNVIREAIIQNTGLFLYAPCLSVNRCPSRDTASHWCHERLEWAPPALIQAIDRYTGFSKHKGVTYTYCTFSKQPHNISETVAASEGAFFWRVVSYPIEEKGRELLYVCNGVERRLLRRLSRHASVSNADFGRAGRGDIVAVSECRKRGDFYDITSDSRFILCAAAGTQEPFKSKNETVKQVDFHGPQTM